MHVVLCPPPLNPSCLHPLPRPQPRSHGFPFSCVSIALCIRQRVVVGVVHNPKLGETFVAARGGGAYLNGVRLAVSGRTQLSEALLGTEVRGRWVGALGGCYVC